MIPNHNDNSMLLSQQLHTHTHKHGERKSPWYYQTFCYTKYIWIFEIMEIYKYKFAFSVSKKFIKLIHSPPITSKCNMQIAWFWMRRRRSKLFETRKYFRQLWATYNTLKMEEDNNISRWQLFLQARINILSIRIFRILPCGNFNWFKTMLAV